MMKDDQPDDLVPVKIVAGLALLVLLGAWWVAAIEAPTGPAQAFQDEAGEPQSQTVRQAAANTPETQAQATVRTAARAQEEQSGDKTVSPQIGRALTDVLELLNANKFAEATATLEPLLTSEALSAMTPFERSRVYQLSFTANMDQGNYAAAQADLQAAIESGGLNAQEMRQMQFQRGQVFMAMEDYSKAADSLELWMAQPDTTPDEGAYYLLAAAYYQQQKFADARDHMETLFTMPGEKQESWYQMLSSLYLEDKAYAKAIPVTQKLVELYGKETYQQQLAALYLQTEDYAAARPVVEKLVELYGKEKYRMQLNYLNQMENSPR